MTNQQNAQLTPLQQDLVQYPKTFVNAFALEQVKQAIVNILNPALKLRYEIKDMALNLKADTIFITFERTVGSYDIDALKAAEFPAPAPQPEPVAPVELKDEDIDAAETRLIGRKSRRNGATVREIS